MTTINNKFRSKEELIESLKKNYFFLEDLKEVYLFGWANLGKFAYNQFTNNGVVVKGIIDSDSKKWDGHTVFGIDALKKDDVVIITSSLVYDIDSELEKREIKKRAFYEILPMVSPSYNHYGAAYVGWCDDMYNNQNEYDRIYKLLEDQASRSIYSDIVKFRTSFDLVYSKKAYDSSLKRGIDYFDTTVFELGDNEVFVDGGGYVGDTTSEFIKQVGGKYKYIYLFEPDKKNIEIAKNNLLGNPNIDYISKGLSEERNTFRFYGSESEISPAGFFQADTVFDKSNSVDVVDLDTLVEEKNFIPTYIKLDIEGFEMKAIQGMRNTIKNHKPKLAISVYHLCGDIHRLTSNILDINPDYKLYFRHYNKQVSGSVMYFI